MKFKKSLLALLFAAAMLITSACGQTGGGNTDNNAENSISDNAPETDENGDELITLTASGTLPHDVPPEANGAFQVKGHKLYDANGNAFVIRGINHAHSWFQDKLDIAIPAIAETGANTVRIVLSDGQQWDRIPLEDVEKIIEICKENKLICILEVHDLTGKDDIEGLRKTVEYWKEIKSALIGNEAYVIVNIANEWVGTWDDPEMWYQGYSEAIAALREADIKNTLMIDGPGWGQFAEPIDTYGETLFNEDPEKNTMFSIHMYGAAGKNDRIIRTNLGYAFKHDICIVVGEFGYNHSDGDVDEDYIMEYCVDNKLGYLGWSWKGNGGGVEYLDIAEDWEGETLSADWGERLINGRNGIGLTSKICSVFDE